MTPPALDAFVTIGALIVGASVGSFLNVVVARVPEGLSIVRPGSRCPRCLAPIAWHDNLPVVSWLLLRARCRGCGALISARYPLVELAGAAAALLALRRHGLSGAAAAELALASSLLALGLIDLDTWLLPHALTWPLLGVGLALSALGLTPAGSLAPSLYGAGIGFAAFAALAVAGRKLLGREALGFGDVWLLAGLGAWLGVRALLPVVLLASLQGTAVGLVLAVLGRLPKGDATPSPLPSPPPGERETFDFRREPPLPPREGEGTVPDREPPLPPGEVRKTAPDREPSLSPGEGEEVVPGREPSLPLPRASEGEGRGEGEDPDAHWVPPKNAVPFGPFLVAGALEWLYVGDRLASAIPGLGVFR